MNTKEYIQQLEETLSKFLTPLKDIPFSIAVKAISRHKVLAFQKNEEKDKKLLELLTAAMSEATKTAYKIGIQSARANEVGNHIEPFVKEAINKVGLQADTPKNSKGKKQATGYPDIFIEDSFDRPTYLERKTYNAKSIGTSLRSFYFQPSANPKIIFDARHLMVSFKIIEEQKNGGKIFVPVLRKLYSLEKLKVQVKHEFNASNKEIYQPETLLAEGKI